MSTRQMKGRLDSPDARWMNGHISAQFSVDKPPISSRQGLLHIGSINKEDCVLHLLHHTATDHVYCSSSTGNDRGSEVRDRVGISSC
jgi:hypothetical protein